MTSPANKVSFPFPIAHGSLTYIEFDDFGVGLDSGVGSPTSTESPVADELAVPKAPSAHDMDDSDDTHHKRESRLPWTAEARFF